MIAEQSSTGGCWNPPKKDTPGPRTKKSQRDGRGAAIRLKSNPKLTRDFWKTQTKPWAQQDPGERSSDPRKRLSQTCLSVCESAAEAWVGSGLLLGQGHWQQQSWEAQLVAQGLLEEAAVSPTTGPADLP